MPDGCGGSVPNKGLRWSESQHGQGPVPRARGGDRDGPATGLSTTGLAANILPNPNTNLHPNPAWARQRELLMHLLPWYTAAAAAAQAQPGNPHLPPAHPPPPPPIWSTPGLLTVVLLALDLCRHCLFCNVHPNTCKKSAKKKQVGHSSLWTIK